MKHQKAASRAEPDAALPPTEMSRASMIRAIAALREYMDLHPAVPPPKVSGCKKSAAQP